jgi:phenylpropionate dioxygenase-like ring-hydroxylating dioxygenase large terminal subunit
MHPPMEKLTCPIDLDALDASTCSPEAAVNLPPACYSDEEFYRFELESVFFRQWLCVGRTEQIPEPGDYFTTTVAGGEPLIVVRDREGAVRVMSSICRHRGMCVTAPAELPKDKWFDDIPETSGNTRNFRCPYHWWVYDLDGHLMAAPEMERRSGGFDRAEWGLPNLRVELWNGFIFCNFDPDASPLGPTLGKLTRLLMNYHLGEMVTTQPEVVKDLPFNWKIMAENFMEAYHSKRLHGNRYDIDPKTEESKKETLIGGSPTMYEPGDGAIAGAGRTAYKDRGLNPTQHALFPPIVTLSDEERWHMIYAFVPPTLLLGVSTDSAFWFLVEPTSVSTHTLSMAFVFPPETHKLKLFDDLFQNHISGVELFNKQDMPSNHAVQVGMSSRFAPRGPLSWQDEFLTQFNSWLADCYRRAAG